MAKGKIVQKVGLGILGVAAIAGGIAFYYWRQFTTVPTWYVQSSTTPPISLSSADIAAAPTGTASTIMQEKIQDSLQNQNSLEGNTVLPGSTEGSNLSSSVGLLQPATSAEPKLVSIQLDETEINQLIATELAQRVNQQPLLVAVKGVNTSLENDRVQAGAVINLSRIPLEQLSDRQQKAIDRLTAMAPGLKNRDLYVGFEGVPHIENGQLKLDRGMRVNLGNMSFTLSEFSQRSGVSLIQLEQRLNELLQAQSLNIQGIQLQDDRVVIEGWVRQ